MPERRPSAAEFDTHLSNVVIEKANTMANIVTFLSYRDRAEEAAKLYCSIFPNSRITRTVAYPDIATSPRAGAVMIVELEMLGQRYILMNGGEMFRFTEGSRSRSSARRRTRSIASGRR